MSGKLVVVANYFSGEQKERIRQKAADRGFAAQFFDDAQSAAPALEDAEIILSNIADTAKRAPCLKWFCTANAGVDPYLKPDAFLNKDVMLSNSSGAYGVTIAEHVTMVTLLMLRRQQEYDAIVAGRNWKRDLPIRSIRGSAVTLLGTGDIGREIAARFRAFQPRALWGVNRSGRDPGGPFDRIERTDGLDALLPHTDILVVALPGTKETYRMLSAARLALLPDGCVIVNVGRGRIIEEEALYTELLRGRLYAALDVFETEPLPADHPLWTCPNLLITPHVAGNTTLPYTRERIVELFLEDLDNYASGRPLKRRVDLEKGY